MHGEKTRESSWVVFFFFLSLWDSILVPELKNKRKAVGEFLLRPCRSKRKRKSIVTQLGQGVCKKS